MAVICRASRINLCNFTHAVPVASSLPVVISPLGERGKPAGSLVEDEKWAALFSCAETSGMEAETGIRVQIYRFEHLLFGVKVTRRGS